MKQKIFISYGSGDYIKSLKRIGKEARSLRIFSKVVLYEEKDLPPFIKSSPLKAYSKGSGYWLWKPYIIWKTLQDYPNSIVVYADSGCVLHNNANEWEEWFDLMDSYDTICFQYRSDFRYPWVSQESSCRNIEWSKKSLIEYFDGLIDADRWLDSPQLMAGVVIAKNSKNPLIKMWLDITLFHPELIVDCIGNEVENQNEQFLRHRHDQSVWSILCEYWKDKGNVVKILPETAESDKNAAVYAARLKKAERSIPIKTRIIKKIKFFIGDDSYDRIHRKLDNNLVFSKIVLYLEHKGVRN